MNSIKPIYNRILQANLYSTLIIVKIIGILVFDLFRDSSVDSLGIYSLAIGFTSAFFVFSGLRARVFVLANVSGLREFLSVLFVIGALGVFALLAVVFVYRSDQFWSTILLVSFVKYLENILEANTSFIQKNIGRELAYKVLNIHGVIVAFTFLMLFPWLGLDIALIGEIVVLIFSICVQLIYVYSRVNESVKNSFAKGKNLVLQSSALTLAASLNAMIVTCVLYMSKFNLMNEEFLFFAKVIVLQSIFARIVTGNNIYFQKEADQYLSQFTKLVLVLCWGACLLAVCLYVSEIGNDSQILGISVLWCLLGVVFTLINISNIMIRQSILLIGAYNTLVVFHFFELLAVSLLFYFSSFNLVESIMALILFRFVRVNYLCRKRFDYTYG